MKLDPSKCNLFLEKVSFLGYIVSKYGLQTNPEKDWPLPLNITEMRQFLGFVNYYRKFVKSFADHKNLLEEIMKTSSRNCTKKNDNTPLIWNDNGKKAFVTIKNVLCQARCLTFPMIYKTYILDTDASHSAIGLSLIHI